MNDSDPAPEPRIPVICDHCRVEGEAGDPAFAAIADLLTFEPVPRRTHVNNWTAEHQRGFIAALAMTGSPKQAARALGRAAYGAEQLRNAKGGRTFADAWAAALELYRERELFRIRQNLAGLADQQESRDQGSIAQTHLRALPPPSSSLLRSNGEGDHAQHGGGASWGEGYHYDEEDEDAEAIAQAHRANRRWDESVRMVRRKLFMNRRVYLHTIVHDPERRAAWETLCGPADWEAAADLAAQPDESDEVDLTPLCEPRWQIPIKTGFAPEFTEPTREPPANPLERLANSIVRHDPRGPKWVEAERESIERESTERNDAGA